MIECSLHVNLLFNGTQTRISDCRAPPPPTHPHSPQCQASTCCRPPSVTLSSCPSADVQVPAGPTPLPRLRVTRTISGTAPRGHQKHPSSQYGLKGQPKMRRVLFSDEFSETTRNVEDGSISCTLDSHK